MELRQCAMRVLSITDPLQKVEQARELHAGCAGLPIAELAPAARPSVPGRPRPP